MILKGKLEGSSYELDSSVSSQFISGLMMGMAAAKRDCVIKATGKFESRGYVGLTVKVLEEFGVIVEGENPYIMNCSQGLNAKGSIVEGDWSNASYFAAMNHMGGEITINGLSLDSCQPDKAIDEVLGKLSRVTDNDIDVSEFPDIMPTIAVYAATLPVITTIRGKRLRYKVSDRIGSVCLGLQNLGIDATELNEGLRIKGGQAITGGEIDTFNDHRIAMAFSVLGCVALEDIIIKDAECIGKSYPDFFTDLEKAGGKIS